MRKRLLHTGQIFLILSRLQKPFCFYFLYDRKKSVSAFQRFPEHLHFPFSEFRHHGIRHLLVEFCVMMDACRPFPVRWM